MLLPASTASQSGYWQEAGGGEQDQGSSLVALMWDVGMPSGGLTTAPNAHPVDFESVRRRISVVLSVLGRYSVSPAS